VERGGVARSFHVDGTSAADVVPFLRANVAREAKLVTDDAGQYRHVGRYFDHQTVAHSVDEYARYERNPDGSEYVIHRTRLKATIRCLSAA
jgi:hypothetical protein